MNTQELRVIANEFETRLRKVLSDVAVPKPTRVSEHYAALTLSIVLLKEQVAGDNVPENRKIAVGRELSELTLKRAALEESLEAVG